MSIESQIAANVYGMGTNTFGQLAVGDSFRFHTSESVYVKTSRNWYSDGRRKFRTGQGTAVFPVGHLRADLFRRCKHGLAPGDGCTVCRFDE